MKAKTSSKGRAFLKSNKASSALVQAIVANPRAFSSGKSVNFAVKVRNGNNSGVTISVKKATS